MRELKTSYILTKSETLLLLSSFVDLQPTLPGRYFLEEYLADSIATEDEVEGLIFKKLVHKEAGTLIIEPVVELLAKSILFANRIWIVKCLETVEPVLIIRAHRLYLFITSYELTEGAIKITPFQNTAELREDKQDEFSIVQITTVSKHGKQQSIKPDNSFKWLEEEHYGDDFY